MSGNVFKHTYVVISQQVETRGNKQITTQRAVGVQSGEISDAEVEEYLAKKTSAGGLLKNLIPVVIGLVMLFANISSSNSGFLYYGMKFLGAMLIVTGIVYMAKAIKTRNAALSVPREQALIDFSEKALAAKITSELKKANPMLTFVCVPVELAVKGKQEDRLLDNVVVQNALWPIISAMAKEYLNGK